MSIPILSASSISIDFGIFQLFNDLTFTLKKGDRVGLIGYNGSGKSTIIKCLDGSIDEYHGQVVKAGQCIIGRVEQELPSEIGDINLYDAILDALDENC